MAARLHAVDSDVQPPTCTTTRQASGERRSVSSGQGVGASVVGSSDGEGVTGDGVGDGVGAGVGNAVGDIVGVGVGSEVIGAEVGA